jgi:hypothetical protein
MLAALVKRSPNQARFDIENLASQLKMFEIFRNGLNMALNLSQILKPVN